MVASAAPARAAIVDLTLPGGGKTTYGWFANTIGSTPATTGLFQDAVLSRTTQFDTTAKTAKITGIAYYGKTGLPFSDSKTFFLGPPVFPNPAPPTATWTVSVAYNNPFTAGVQEFVSSTPGVLTPGGLDLFRFTTADTVNMPDSFTFSGHYRVVGPTTTIDTPFSITYTRVGASQLFFENRYAVQPGAKFPTTTKVRQTGHKIAKSLYTPSAAFLFNQTIDGTLITAQTTNVTLLAIPLPEPSSVMLLGAALGGVALTGVVRRRRGRARNLTT